MASQEYNYCKTNIQAINAGNYYSLQLFCSNVIQAHESKNPNPVVSTQKYYCGNSGTYLGMKLYRQQEGVLNVLNGSTYKTVNEAYLPPITQCNQYLY